MTAHYIEGEGWYWIEQDVQFGPYPTETDTRVEELCLPGSQKYDRLYAGQLPPRLGDFIKDRDTGWCGLVAKIGMIEFGNHEAYGYLCRGASGDMSIIWPHDAVWIAPVEWDLAGEDDA